MPSSPGISVPDPMGYRVKRKLLGQPLPTEQLDDERLGKPTALAVFASDNLSSSAYATEEILRVLVPAIGVAAFSLVVPITLAMLAVLFVLILSYRQTIKEYPTAGGAYMVTRDNFGILPAQVAGVALLTDYVLTVAVSVAAGVAALVSAFPALTPWTVVLSVAFIGLIAFGNLRGVKESGRVFAVPTYFFILNMCVLLGLGLFRMVFGHLPMADHSQHGLLGFGTHSGDGLLMGATVFLVLHAFASGGAAVTGVEAISNGVPAFRQPAWKNARSTLVVMGSLLGVMFLGLSILGAHLQVAPFAEGTPTVISQIGDLIYGDSVVGRVLFFSLQAGTMLILVLAANTSFADFPRLASFHAGDNFMPRQLTKRGHRLVFSNGIIFLSLSATLLVVVTGAKVDRLIPLYAIGVFTSFTLSQAGMARHHVRLKEPGWKSGLVINGVGAVMTLVVDVVIAITKFTHGAWVIILLVPLMVLFLVRLARQYETEDEQLDHDVPDAVAAPILRRHVVLVFVDRLDLAAARAIQYARTLMPDDMRAVHFVLDQERADDLAAAWTRHGMTRIALDLVDCPDRRITRVAVDTVAHDLAGGDTEVSVLLPDRKYSGFWHRILHDQTAEAIE
ncbi:MAG TPA: APC family permease, partial [Acidimicrobiales bacterium]|nr:APC family permease [Acidimicrobiales bacterium]